MPLHDPHPTDPTELVGVEIACEEESVREMACTFADELAWRGETAPRILQLFATPEYAGPHLAWQLLGRGAIEAIVAESVAAFGALRVEVRDAPGPAGSADRLVRIRLGKHGREL